MNGTPSPSKPANINVSLAPKLAQLVSKQLMNPGSSPTLDLTSALCTLTLTGACRNRIYVYADVSTGVVSRSGGMKTPGTIWSPSMSAARSSRLA